MKRKKLTNNVLRKLINEEKRRLRETLELGLKHPEEVAKRTKEIAADKYANTLEDCINHYKLMKLKEAKLKRDLKRIQETKRRLKRKLLNNLD